MHIPSEERNYLGSIRQTDLNGQVFEFQGEIFRCIYPDKVAFVRSLFDRGVVKRLIDDKLLVHTELTDHTTDGFGLVLKHEKVPCVVDATEWCLPVLQKAALLTLKLMRVLHEYDLTLVDGTVGNVSVMPGAEVLFHDFTSIVPFENYHIYENGMDSFAYHFYYKLKMQQRFGSFALLQQLNLHLPVTKEMYFRLSYFWLFRPFYGASAPAHVSDLQSKPKSPLVNPNNYQSFLYGPFQLLGRVARQIRQRLKPASDDEIDVRTKAAMLARIIKLEREIGGMQLSHDATYWGDYYGGVKPGTGTTCIREEVILDTLKKIDPPQVTDIGSNMGFFSFLAAEVAPVVIAVDYDQAAVGQMAEFVADPTSAPERSRVVPAVASLPIMSDEQLRRYRSHTVMALALTHHLILTQRVPLDQIVASLSALTERHLLVEFMVHGLGAHGANVPDPLPETYTIEHYKAAFAKEFDVVEEVPYEQGEVVSVRLLIHCQKLPKA
jgi:hypothetical protein